MNTYRVTLDEKNVFFHIEPLTGQSEKPNALHVADIQGDTPEAALLTFGTNGQAAALLKTVEDKIQLLQNNKIDLAKKIIPGTHAGIIGAMGQGLEWSQRKAVLLRALIAD